MQRSQAKLLYAAVCAASALLCALNRAPVLAVVNGVAALVVFRVRFGLALESPDVDTLIGKLRDARTAEAEDDEAARLREELLAELRGDGVNLVVISEDGQVAKIGEKRIRVGDIIRGFRVVQIAADGIELVEHKTE